MTEGTPCPRCGAKLVMVDGWAEYGDQLVEIQRLGCWKCGYALYEEGDDPEDDEFE